ncbi:MAG TPA: hypothetical protein VFH34_02805 [Anaerolineales bacterium]|nr:hypothetical protein [Anaerolineales bacterium]
MNFSIQRFSEKSIFVLLTINILIGLFVFRNYGYSWDEPLFYDYGDALGYAYSPREWFSGNFDLGRSYGSSGDDHKTRGPAYLLLARGPVYLLEQFGLDQASAWHLINFLFFQAGVYFLYRLASRWMKPSAAFAASALFSWQPLLWGHAFINPKDPPFLVFFTAAVCLGFEMVDHLADKTINNRPKFSSVFIPAIVLGITTSIRVLGPLAGLLVLAYALWRFRRSFLGYIPQLALYAMIAILAMFATWPFLWENPFANFIAVFRLMSDNPTNLSVLFGGEVFRAGELPRRYMPFILVTTLTESVWPLFIFGIFVGYFQLFRQTRNFDHDFQAANPANSWASFRSSIDLTVTRNKLISLTLVLFWFGILLAYVLLRRPAMYDGMRHFLFILPPVFIFTGFAFEFLTDHLPTWLYAALILLVLAPGVFGFARLHPYEYTYYNAVIGGTDGAFRQYETDYWLTCYKEAVGTLERTSDTSINLYVHREAYIADYYADEAITVHELRGALDQVQPGDYVLVNTRTNEDRRIFKDAPSVIEVRRGEAIFCQIKQIP